MLKRLLAIVLAMVMLVAVLSGCGSPKSSKDVINVVVGSEPATLDPGLNNSVDGGIYILHNFEGLTRQDKDEKTIPGIATKWEVSADGLKYTFHLRDAKWSDGQPVKAADFEYAWKRALSPELASEYAYQVWYIKGGYEYSNGTGKVEDVGVKAVDDKTLEVTLAAPTPYFLELCRFPTYMPVRKDIVDKFGAEWTQKPESYIGNGSYKMTKWEHNAEITYEKSDTYWDKGNVAFIKTISWKLMDDEAAALSAYEAGDLDLVDALVPQAEIQNLVAAGKAKIYDEVGTYYIYFNVDKDPLKDKRVREALSLAIDRQYIVDKVTRAGQIASTGIVPFKTPGLDPKKDFRTEGGDLVPKTGDVAKAKQLLADAGYPDGKGFPEIELYYNTQSGHKAIMEAVMEMWKTNLGVTVKSPNMEWKVLQEKVNSKDFVMSRMGWIGDYNDPMTFFDMWLSDSSQNNTNFNNAEYDKLIRAAKATADNKVRMDNMHKAEQIFIDEMPAVPIYFYVSVFLENPAVKNHRVSPLAFLYLQYAYIE